MTQQQTRLGDDGSGAHWFLELAGLDTEPDTWERQPLDAGDGVEHSAPPLPVTADSAPTSTAPPPGATTGSGTDPFEDWQPTELESSARSRRTFRWSFVSVVVAMGVGIVALLAWLPGYGERIAEGRAGEYREALAEVGRTAENLESAIALLMDPTIEDVGPASTAVADYQAAVEALGSLAREPLPATLPLVPRADVEGLEPARVALSVVAGEAEESARALAGAVDYRLSIDEAFVLPVLPVQATEDQIADLRLELASMLADSAGVAAGLPGDEVFAEHRQELDTALTTFDDLQVTYLDALRRNDVPAATELVAQLAALDDGLADSLAVALAALAPEVRQQVEVVLSEVAAAEALLAVGD